MLEHFTDDCSGRRYTQTKIAPSLASAFLAIFAASSLATCRSNAQSSSVICMKTIFKFQKSKIHRKGYFR